MLEIDWQATANAAAAAAVIGTGGAFVAWLRASYKQFNAMNEHLMRLQELAEENEKGLDALRKLIDESIKRAEQSERRIEELSRAATESLERARMAIRKVRVHDQRLNDHHKRLRTIERKLEQRCDE
jgi:hypothetical protein